jgi:hypothetical protein
MARLGSWPAGIASSQFLGSPCYSAIRGATTTDSGFALRKLGPTTREAHSAPLGATARLENEDYALLAPTMRFMAVEAQDLTSEGRIHAQR